MFNKASLETFTPSYSLVSTYVEEHFSPLTVIIAVPAFATLDIAYHSTAAVLKSLGIVHYNASKKAPTTPTEHLKAVKLAVIALFAYPILGICSQHTMLELHYSLRPKPVVSKWKKLALGASAFAATAGATALAYGKLAATAIPAVVQAIPKETIIPAASQVTETAVVSWINTQNGQMIAAALALTTLAGITFGLVKHYKKPADPNAQPLSERIKPALKTTTEFLMITAAICGICYMASWGSLLTDDGTARRMVYQPDDGSLIDLAVTATDYKNHLCAFPLSSLAAFCGTAYLTKKKWSQLSPYMQKGAASLMLYTAYNILSWMSGEY